MMAGALFNPRRNQTEYMTDPLALGTLTYGKKLFSAQLTEEAIWLFGNPAVEVLSQAGSNAPAHSFAFPDGGLYVLADAQPYALTMVGRCRSARRRPLRDMDTPMLSVFG